MGDIGSVANALKGNPTLQNLEQGGYQQYGGSSGPQLNLGAYGPISTAQAQAAQAQNTNINMGQANSFLGGQQGLVAALQAQAAGSGPSLAQAQLRQGTEANLSGQLAAAASQRGNQNPGGAQYALGNQAAAANQAAAGQAAQTRAQEQLSAEQGLGQTLGAYGGQQIGLAENQAGLNQGTSLANLSAAQQAAITNAGAQNANAQFNTASAQQGNNAQQAQFQYQNSQADQSINQTNQILGGMATNAANAANTATTGAVGGIMNGGAAAAATKWGGGGGGGGGGSAIDSSGSTQWSDGTSGWDESGSAKGALITKPTVRVLGEHSKPEVVVPLDGKMDPQAFLAAMIAKQKDGGGTTPGGPVDRATMDRALAEAAKSLHERVTKLEKKRKG